LLSDALAELAGIGVVLYNPHIRSMLAEVYAGCDQHGRALQLLDEALDICARTGEVWAEPELYRQEGELLRSNPEVAKACFERSIEIARSQSARLFEGRAAANLARRVKAG
jgi:predicted ATPase